MYQVMYRVPSRIGLGLKQPRIRRVDKIRFAKLLYIF
jgi:hypothetical protein